MTTTTYNVRLDEEGSKPYSPAFQTQAEFAAGWKAVLTKAHQNDTALRCGCPGAGEKRLAVRYYDEADAYGLARYPLTGEQHSNDCRFYAPNPDKSGMSCYAKHVVEEGPMGSVRIRLEVGLRKRSTKSAPTNATPHTGERQAQPAMRMLGLLHFLWEQAGLNTWWPGMEGKRNTWRVISLLRHAGENISVSRMSLDKVLLLGGSRDESITRTNTERLANAIRDKQRLVVIAPLAKYRLVNTPTSLPIAGFGGIPILSMHANQWAQLRQRFPRVMTAWEDGGLTYVIAAIDPRENPRFARIVELAVMSVTDNWIPVESGFEKRIADKLTAEHRGFLKPLRFDAECDVVFPDFILRDTGSDTPLEVFGRSDEAYVARKNSKVKYYQTKFGVNGWWCWDAASDPNGATIKPFPISLRGKQSEA